MTGHSDLNKEFAISNELEFVHLTDNFPVAQVRNQYATARIALQGAQVLTWVPRDQQPVIWLSSAAKLATGKSIRGGVPICWPWFGAHASEAGFPGHGYARTVPWQVLATQHLEDGRTRLVFRLAESAATRRYWPHATPVECQITIGPSLDITLVTTNRSDQSITISEALHTYFEVGNIAQVRVLGLEDCEYLDKVDAMQRMTQHGPVTINSEVDRVYLNTRATCIIEDAALQRRILIDKQNSATTVVWNPWQEKAEQMGDLGDDGYRHMLCVESGNAAENTVDIVPGAQHQLAVSYRVQRWHPEANKS